MAEAEDPAKHVHLQGGDLSSESSDEHEHHEVEVTFEPGKAHRRKSSLETHHIPKPHFQRHNRQSECIVHQFLQSQRLAEDAAESWEDQDVDHDHGKSRRSSSTSHTSQPALYQATIGKDGLATVVEKPDDMSESPDTPSPSAAIDGSPELQSSGVGARGQADEEAWKSETAHSIISCSDVDNSDKPVKVVQEELQSRLLTKKQLSDMAWGVRELSRRLSSIRLKPRVRSLFILTKIFDRDLAVKTRELVSWLLSSERERRYVVYVEERLKNDKLFDVESLVGPASDEYATKHGVEVAVARDKVSKQLRYWDANICLERPHSFDFVITLGGDGTVLYASRLFQSIVPPVISFSLGSLGFLTKFDFNDFGPTLTSAFSQGVTVSLRLRFEGTIMRSVKGLPSVGQGSAEEIELSMQTERDLVEELIGEEKGDERTHKPDGTFHVLNEIVVERGPNPTLSNLELFGDDEHFTSILADGVCVSTPTGSTAYNLAAGGSLCHPENPIMLVTSIAPHTLSFRPIILPDTIVLRVGVPYDSRTSSWASFDGRERVELHPGDYITISASRYPFASVQAQGRRSEDWVSSISGKLGWNKRQKQKVYKI
ncbi:related to UTR1 (associated with ferric reductase activity) [Cephalotrichum gorgonifer]|uniref:Related to UTR1 (Associated with ferric reductase activity) n=1 Tax=Cephalotrichum gorgonifer TaxID=2041049 RepID=A0AAE8MSI5_9PEZI|nr:related to UTR1 (associated with ferric reductase activity) [Cephalotrichum gorgonifer]